MSTGSRHTVAAACLSAALAAVYAPQATGQSTDDELRRNLAWQIALERVGFSPGLIDGKIGRKTEIATREFQRVRGLPITGTLDSATTTALRVDAERVLDRYTIQPSDPRQIGDVPKCWQAKSKLARLKYESLAELVAEKFHCTRGLLATLNPSVPLERLAPGDTLTVPRVADTSAATAARLDVDLSEKIIRVRNASDELIALFHCSVAADKANLPSGTARVISVTDEPTYTFDPKMWPEVKGVKEKLLIPPGPRNPVGLCWVGLSLPGYGIHGTPNPELIGKTGSHGCIRLTNWDAQRLGRMVRSGTPVRFVRDGELALKRP